MFELCVCDVTSGSLSANWQTDSSSVIYIRLLPSSDTNIRFHDSRAVWLLLTLSCSKNQRSFTTLDFVLLHFASWIHQHVVSHAVCHLEVPFCPRLCRLNPFGQVLFVHVLWNQKENKKISVKLNNKLLEEAPGGSTKYILLAELQQCHISTWQVV